MFQGKLDRKNIMKIWNTCKKLLLSFCSNKNRKQHGKKYDIELSLHQSFAEYQSLNDICNYYDHYFHYRCPMFIREHRNYIVKHKKGFGENAFYAMWWLLLLEFKPKSLLEIGVYRGQVVSLWSLIMKYINVTCDVHCISPFKGIGDSISTYDWDIDYYKDTMNTFNYWNLPSPNIVKALSTDAKATKHIKSKKWDLIYIDGSHEFNTALSDYTICRENLRQGGIMVMDDASLYLDYKPGSQAFAGHPGSSHIASEFGDKEMKFLGAVGHNNLFMKI